MALCASIRLCDTACSRVLVRHIMFARALATQYANVFAFPHLAQSAIVRTLTARSAWQSYTRARDAWQSDMRAHLPCVKGCRDTLAIPGQSRTPCVSEVLVAPSTPE